LGTAERCQRRNVYERELVLDERFAPRWSFRAYLAFTFVNGKASLGALGVNMLIRKSFHNCRKTAADGHLLRTMNRIFHEYSRTSFSDSERGTS